MFCSVFVLGQNKTEKALSVLEKDPHLKSASWGFCAYEVESGKMLVGRSPDQSLIPASSLKVVTTATALKILGPEYKFKTEIQYDGVIDANGVLNGNLYLKGYGDPTLASPELDNVLRMDALLQDWTSHIRNAGIRSVNGKIVGDGTWFDSQQLPTTWQWNDLGNYYAAGASGLNLHENLYYLNFKQNPSQGKTPAIKNIEPDYPFVTFVNEVVSKGTRDNAYIFGAPYSNTRYVRGSIPAGKGTFTIKGAVPDPPFFAAYHLTKVLEKNGIQTLQEMTTYRELKREGFYSTKRKIIHTNYSPPLRVIVEEANMESVNLYCEVLLKAIGKKQKGKGTTEAGLEVVKETWKAAGVNVEGFFMEDGSGLSPRNAVTTRQLAALMRKTYLDKNIDKIFISSLPLAGESGSLKHMLKGTAVEGKLRAKSGYIRRVRSYTGFCPTQNGKMVAFCFIINNHTASNSAIRKKMEKVMATLYYL